LTIEAEGLIYIDFQGRTITNETIYASSSPAPSLISLTTVCESHRPSKEIAAISTEKKPQSQTAKTSLQLYELGVGLKPGISAAKRHADKYLESREPLQKAQ